MAQYLHDHKLPSVAEITNSAKKDAIEKKERNRGGGSQQNNHTSVASSKRRAKAKSALDGKAE